MDPLFVIFIAVGSMLLGLAVGWFLGGKPVADWKARHSDRDVEAKGLDEKLKAMTRDLATMSERASKVDELQRRLDELQDKYREAEAALASLRSESSVREHANEERYREREAHFERELKRLVEAEEKLQAKFNEIGEKMLEGAQSKFLESAHSRLEKLNKESLAELEKKVGPVGETLERYRKRVEEIEKANTAGFNQLQGVLGEVRAGQERVIEGAREITTTLRGAPKAGGDWGELQLENLLRSCGLYDRADFNFQVTVSGDEGALLRPDAVINIPGGRCLVVDVKNVFNSFERANKSKNDEERRELLKTHSRQIQGHIDELSTKRYQDFVPGSADFVVMFIPGEHVLYAALTEDHGLVDYALKKRIVLSSPLNFMSIALTVATIWRQAGMQADAEEVAKLGKELYDQLGVVTGHLSNLRRALQKTNEHFDSLVGSVDRKLRLTGERFQKLAVDTSAKELVDVVPLNSTPRRLANFPDPDEEVSDESVSTTPRLVDTSDEDDARSAG